MNKALIILVALMINGFVHAAAEPSQNPDSTVIIYYFHSTVRCPSCTLLEELVRDTVEMGFPREIENGKVTMHVINVDEKDNEHFVDDYNLSVQSVVLSQVEHGKEKRWKNLDRIWALLEDQEQLWDYLLKEIQGFVKETHKIPREYPKNSAFRQG